MKLIPIKAYLMNRATLNRVSTYKKIYMLVSNDRPVDIVTSAIASSCGYSNYTLKKHRLIASATLNEKDFKTARLEKQKHRFELQAQNSFLRDAINKLTAIFNKSVKDTPVGVYSKNNMHIVLDSGIRNPKTSNEPINIPDTAFTALYWFSHLQKYPSANPKALHRFLEEQSALTLLEG